MRIITGSAKGHTIKVPNKKIRPAQDMVRQAVFSMLQGLVKDAKVLDLFAGSGSYGLEALSRGARKTEFVDIDKRSIHTIKINLKEMNFESRGEVIRSDAMNFVEDFGKEKAGLWNLDLKPGFEELPKAGTNLPNSPNPGLENHNPGLFPSEGFDLIFLSPPYKMGAQIHLLKHLEELLASQGVIIFDHARETKVPKKINGLEKIRYRTYGATGISILAKTGKS